MIPKQLQNENFRFVLLGKWDEWGRYETINGKSKLVEKKKIKKEDYDKYDKHPDWKPLGKTPFEVEWQKKGYRYNDSKLLEYIKSGGNYGVVGGYGNLRILDIDNPEKLEEFNLDTFIVETGGGGRHIYLLSDYDKNNVLTENVGEFRAKNYQVVGCGCTHPNGKKYKIIKDKPIRFIDKLVLKSILSKYLRENIESSYDKKETDKTRSGKEFGTICNLIKKGLNKEEIFKEMLIYSKWASSHNQYKEMTYKKAKIKVEEKKESKETNNKRKYTSLFLDEEKTFIAEQVYKEGVCKFCVYDLKTKKYSFMDEIETKDVIIRPISGEEIDKGAIKLPSEPLEYKNDKRLDDDIKKFINKWLDVPKNIVLFGLWNIKRSWVYERFHTLNYLRALGDTGVGKSRFLDTLGYLHYKPISTSGATTSAPIFRIIDKWKGTLIMDEADLHKSDESQDIIKIINQGYEKGKYVMRCDKENQNKVNFFDPFCPKILATRRAFFDKATESRCITYVMKETARKDIPLNLNKHFWDDLLVLRNKLLMWRFRNYYKINPEKVVDFDFGELEPRVKQIVSSFVNLFSKDKEQLENFNKFITRHQEEIIEERRNSFEGSVVGAIFSLLKRGESDINSSDIIHEGELTNLKNQPLQPRALSNILKGLGFGLPISRKVEGKTKRCLALEPVRVENLLKRYGYAVTEVTLNTIQENLLLKGFELGKNPKSSTLRKNRDNRNSVTSATKSEPLKIKEEKVEDD